MSEWSHDYWAEQDEEKHIGVPAPPPVVYKVRRKSSHLLRPKRGQLYRELQAKNHRKWVGLE